MSARPATPPPPPLPVDKTPARIAGMFDAIAPRYDLLNHVLSAGLDRRWRKIPDHQRSLAQVTEIWELLVLTHPGYDEFQSDGQWGWARKSSSEQPPARLLVKRDLVGAAVSLARLGRGRLRASRLTRG